MGVFKKIQKNQKFFFSFFPFFERERSEKGQILQNSLSLLKARSLKHRERERERESGEREREKAKNRFVMSSEQKKSESEGPSVDLDACARRLKSLYSIWNDDDENQLFNDADGILPRQRSEQRGRTSILKSSQSSDLAVLVRVTGHGDCVHQRQRTK